MSVYKARDEAVAPVIEPTNWKPLIGVVVVAATLAIALLGILLLGSTGPG